uniref:Reverse transcriptase/retrotransposon-derived protein RNase H-like domain-containing protein n=1 Tax=Tanacetum cinerariifolium TaxID=118510 RepID=A0A6L2JXC6_TANCI|nr:hypothetical protein [Tanacetum cinerariifolium]
MMREEMEKLIDEMRTATASLMGVNEGVIVKNQGDQRKDNVSDEKKVPLILIHLFDIALMWHKLFIRLLGSDIVPWVDIRADQAISFYMVGLPTDIELVVRKFKPQTLSVAHSLSKLQSATNEEIKKKNKARLFPTPYSQVKQLSFMRQQQLYAKSSKGIFKAPQVEYLAHIITNQGAATDPHKVQALVDWLMPTTFKQLRGFLGLTEYYRRSVKNYASISMPLTALLNKNAFGWNGEVQTAFETLKCAMIQVISLQLPDFNETFLIETDAYGVGIGVVLQQNGHPVAFLSKTLAPEHQTLSTYDREFLDPQVFVRLENHQSCTNEMVSKAHGFDYDIMYKKGAENVVADALLRIHGQAETLQIGVTTLSSELYDKVKQGWQDDTDLKARIEKM